MNLGFFKGEVYGCGSLALSVSVYLPKYILDGWFKLDASATKGLMPKSYITVKQNKTNFQALIPQRFISAVRVFISLFFHG